MSLDTPQTPKAPLTNVGHHEDLKVVENLMKDALAEEKIKELNLFPELQEDRSNDADKSNISSSQKHLKLCICTHMVSVRKI